jgi:hypothetical protein
MRFLRGLAAFLLRSLPCIFIYRSGLHLVSFAASPFSLLIPPTRRCPSAGHRSPRGNTGSNLSSNTAWTTAPPYTALASRPIEGVGVIVACSRIGWPPADFAADVVIPGSLHPMRARIQSSRIDCPAARQKAPLAVPAHPFGPHQAPPGEGITHRGRTLGLRSWRFCHANWHAS